MIFSSFRPVGLVILSLALAACASPLPADATPATPVLGVDLGASGPVAAHAAGAHAPYALPRGAIQKVHDGHAHAQGTGTVNTVDAAGRKLNISHEPIPAIGFPAMTMDFAVAPAVNLATVKLGTRITFTLERGADGMFVIQSITPAGGGAR